jgi:sugar phosphate isomerase/epimerase
MNRKVALQLRSDEPWKEIAEMMHRAGFGYVAMAFSDENEHLLQDDWQVYVRDMASVFKKNELKCVMTHAPYYSLMISAEQRDEKMELMMLRCIEATKMLGAEICAVHPRSFLIPGVPPVESCDRQRSLEENLIAFKPLVEALAEYARTGNISADNLSALRRHRHLCEELCATEHPADESYLRDISSERPTQQALAREIYLRCEPLFVKYEGFLAKIK